MSLKRATHLLQPSTYPKRGYRREQDKPRMTENDPEMSEIWQKSENRVFDHLGSVSSKDYDTSRTPKIARASRAHIGTVAQGKRSVIEMENEEIDSAHLYATPCHTQHRNPNPLIAQTHTCYTPIKSSCKRDPNDGKIMVIGGDLTEIQGGEE